MPLRFQAHKGDDMAEFTRRYERRLSSGTGDWPLPDVPLFPPCDFCDGQGDYPIHNVRGGHGFNIQCPACQGTGRRG